MAEIDFSLFEQCVEEYGAERVLEMIESFDDYGFSTLESIGIEATCLEADSALLIDEQHKNSFKEAFKRLDKKFETLPPYNVITIANNNFSSSEEETLPEAA